MSIDSVLFFLLDRVHWGSPWDLPFAGVFFILNFPGMLLTGNPHSWGIPCAVISSLVYAFVIFKIVQFRAQRGAKKIQPNLSSKRKSRTSAGLNQIVIILSLFFFGPRTLAGSEERGVVRNDDPAIKIDIPGTLKELKEALRAGRVTQVDLIHVSNHASFRTTISSDLLKQTYESKVIITNPGSSAYISEFQKLIERLDAAALDRPTDLRWGCIFTMTDRAKPIEIFSDKAGKTGVIDGALVTFKNGDVAQWAEKAFGKVLE